MYLRGRPRSESPRRLRPPPVWVCRCCSSHERARMVATTGYRPPLPEERPSVRLRLEGDVVVRAAARARPGALEVRGVGGYVRVGWKPLPPPPPPPGLSEREPRNWTMSAMISTAWRFDPSCASHSRQSRRPSHRHRPSLREVVGAVLALRAPDGDVEVVGLVDPLAGGAVLSAAVDGHSELADGGPAGSRAQLGVLRQIACDYDRIDVRAGQLRLPSSFRFRTSILSSGAAGSLPRCGERPETALRERAPKRATRSCGRATRRGRLAAGGARGRRGPIRRRPGARWRAERWSVPRGRP